MAETDSTRTKFIIKIPGFPANSREFQTEFVEKGVDCFVPYFKQIYKDPSKVTFCFLFVAKQQTFLRSKEMLATCYAD